MLVKLYELPEYESLKSKLLNNGIIIRRAMAYEKQKIVHWIQENFEDGWASECDVAFSNSPISCFIAIKEGNILGFACYEATCKAFFGPTGVIESQRGLGIGRALLMSALLGLSQLGYAYGIIGDVGPVEFYKKAVGAILIEGSTPGIYRNTLQ